MFVCEQCWGVYPDTCPTCPDRGNGRGVTVDQIKQAFRDCPSVASVNATAQHFARHVALLEREGGEARTLAIHIKNLAKYMRREIQKGMEA